MKKIIILFTIAILGMISCAPYPSGYPWGVENNGIKTRLIPLKNTFTLGEPIMFRLEMTNVDTAPISYRDSFVANSDSLLIKDASGQQVKYYETYSQVCRNKNPVIIPNEIICLFSDLDIIMQYHICKPGRYTVQFNGKYDKLPLSNTVEIEVKDGKLSEFDIIRCRLLHSMPKEWQLYQSDGFGVHEELIRLKEQGMIVEKHFMMLLPPQKGIVDNILVWHTKKPMDISKIKYETRPYSLPLPVAEYLGHNQWGYAYWEYTPKAIEFWPRAKEDIIKALDIIPNDIKYYYNQALYATQDQRFEDAIQYYEKAIALNPNDAATYYNLGMLYDECLDNPAKAIFCYNKYFNLEPNAADREKVKKWIENFKKRLKNK